MFFRRIKPVIVSVGLVLVCWSAPGTADDAKTPPVSKPTAPSKTQAPAPIRSLRGDLSSLLGRKVQSPTHEDLGQIIDILMNQEGAATAAVIDFGGFLGVGSRKIAVDWHALHFAPTHAADAPVVLDFTASQLTSAPAYEDGKTVVLLRAAGATESSSPPKPSAK